MAQMMVGTKLIVCQTVMVVFQTNLPLLFHVLHASPYGRLCCTHCLCPASKLFLGVALGFVLALGRGFGLAFATVEAFAFAFGARFFFSGVFAFVSFLPFAFGLLFAAHFAVGRTAWLGDLRRNKGERRGSKLVLIVVHANHSST